MKKRINNLKSVMAVQSTSYNTKMMNNYIKDFVKNVPNCKIYKDHGNLYVTKGESDLYPCVVAHTDTVHDVHKEFIVQRYNDVLYAINGNYERVGIGGDDKVGIFVALEILRTTPICKVAFFRDEEVGCQGSKLADMSFFKDVSLVLQCDRQGYADFVNNIFWSDLFTYEFSQAIAPLLEKYDRVESDGGMTDVWQLTENGLDVACANMSCGYYDPHSDNEYIVISEVLRTLDFVEDVIDELGGRKWKVSPSERGGYKSDYYGRHYGGSYKKSGYRRYGGGEDDLFNDFDSLRSNKSQMDDWKEENKIVGATCCICDKGGEVAYDDTVDMFWCYGCEDYIREDMVEFSEGIIDSSTELDKWQKKFSNAYDDYLDDDGNLLGDYNNNLGI